MLLMICAESFGNSCEMQGKRRLFSIQIFRNDRTNIKWLWIQGWLCRDQKHFRHIFYNILPKS